MANFTYGAGVDPFASSPTFSLSADWERTALSSTRAIWESADLRIELSGTGLRAGTSPAGSITGVRVFEIDLSSGAAVDVLLMQNTSALSLSFAALLASFTDDPAEDFPLPGFILRGNDLVTGSATDDELLGYAGNDTLLGGNGADVLVGDSYDNFSPSAPTGRDSLVGGAGADYLDGGTGIDTLRGGADNDLYVVAQSGDVVVEAAGEGSHDRVVFSGDFGLLNYTLPVNVENLDLERLEAAGAMTAVGNASANKIGVAPFVDFGSTGAGGRERLLGLGGNDRLSAADGADTLDGGTGADTMIGGTGNDLYLVDNAGDRIVESATAATEIDTVQSSLSWTLGANLERLSLTGGLAINGVGNTLANTLTGNAGANNLNGGAGNDLIAGGNGNDTLNGSTGSDTVVGGAGNDSLIGSSGADAFRLASAPSATTNVDRLADFVAVDDRVELENAVFTALGLTTGAIDEAAYRAGGSATEADDRIVYNVANGQIRYDADGSGAGASVLIATVAAGTLMSAADFWIV